MTVQDLVTLTLTAINAVQAGETPNSDDSNLMLSLFNGLIGSWNAALRKSMAATYDPSVYTFVPVAQFTVLTEAITLPGGWQRALMWNGALDVAIPFGRSVPDGLVQLAAQSKAEIITPQNTGPTS